MLFRSGGSDAVKDKGKENGDVAEVPDVSVVIKALGGEFKEVLKGMEVMG